MEDWQFHDISKKTRQELLSLPCYASVLLCVQCISFPDYISCGADITIYCGLRLKKRSFLHSFCLFEYFECLPFFTEQKKNSWCLSLFRTVGLMLWVTNLTILWLCMQSDRFICRWKLCADESCMRMRGCHYIDVVQYVALYLKVAC